MKPSPPCSGSPGPGPTGAVTCGLAVPVVTARARRDPRMTDAVRTQRDRAVSEARGDKAPRRRDRRCRYSTTMTVLRRARVAFAKRRRAGDGVPLDAWGRPEDDQGVIVVASWVFVGAGYATEGERWLALSAAARAREQRAVAREELRTTVA